MEIKDAKQSLQFLTELITNEVELVKKGERDAMLVYCFYKDLEKTLKNAIDEIYKDLNYNDYDLDTLPFSYSGRVTHKLTIDYESNSEYKTKKDDLKVLEKTLKDAVLLAQSGKTLNDENGCIIDAPEWKQTEIFSIVKKKSK